MTDPATLWTELEARGAAAAGRSILGLFAAEAGRLEQLASDAAGLRLDLSKQTWSLQDFACGLRLVEASGLTAARARLFAGERVNVSEDRAATHMALRAPMGATYAAGGVAVSPDVEVTRVRMKMFADAVTAGLLKGATGKPFRSIIHIGIGGSDLGPRLVWEALRPLNAPITPRFVANVDPAELAFALEGLDPAETLIIVVSKSFTTQETLTNAVAARDWLRASLGPAGDSQMVAVSAAPELAKTFGVPNDQVFAFWDWVGGRYSLWSAVGLSCAIALGYDVFERLLAGAHEMDQHFQTAPLETNLPVRLALAHVFNRNAMGRPLRAVIPYAQRLALFPAYLQQLEMESNGKSVTAQGRPVTRPTAAAVFGDAGTNGQHAFFQALHQGSDIIPVDFIAVRESSDGDPTAHTKLLANAVAQAEALMVGRSAADSAGPQQTFEGNRPSSFLIVDNLTPERLGAVLALYEHKVFVEGVLWGINSFDQWGVELGKSLAAAILPELEGQAQNPHDPSTTDLIARLKS